MIEFVLSTLSARRMLVWVLDFGIDLAPLPQREQGYGTAKAVSISMCLIMLILNSTGISILGLFLIDRWELKQFKMHSQYVEIYIPKYVWCKDQKGRCHWDRILVYFLLTDNFESCCFIPETCKTCIIYCWHLSVPENQISLFFLFSWVLLLLFFCDKGSGYHCTAHEGQPPSRRVKLLIVSDVSWVTSTLNLHCLMINFSKHKYVCCLTQVIFIEEKLLLVNF